MNELVQFGRNLDFKIRRDHEKISHERRAYESVDDRSLSWAIARKLMKKNSGYMLFQVTRHIILHRQAFYCSVFPHIGKVIS